MGGHEWFYFVEYEEAINAALQKLREREFRAGRYNSCHVVPGVPRRAGLARAGGAARFD